MIRTLVHAAVGDHVHEPPLFGLLRGDAALAPVLDVVGARIGAVGELLAAGSDEDATRTFVETIAFGEGAWSKLPEETRPAERSFTKLRSRLHRTEVLREGSRS